MKKFVAIVLTALMLATLLPGCGAKNEGFDESKIVLQFGAISDLQHGNLSFNTQATGKQAYTRLQQKALEYTDKGLDAIFFAGDLVDHAYTPEVQEFKAIYEGVLDPTEVPLIFCLGNHDVKATGSQKEELNFEYFYDILGEEYRGYEEETSDLKAAGVHQIVNGYHFVAVNPLDSGYSGYASAPYAQETKDWLDKTLAEITSKNPDQYVFVATHPMIYDTTYGSNLIVNNFAWYTDDLTDILKKYPQVITFGGHLHFPISDERSIMQTDFTSLGCGSVTYMATEDGNYRYMRSLTVMDDCAQVNVGYLVQVDKHGNVRFLRMNFRLNETIKEPWVLMAPQEDGSHLLSYTKDRGSAENNAAPVLAADAITITDDRDTISADTPIRPHVTFKSATDDDQIHNYQLIITDENGQVVEQANLLADSYLHTDPADMRDEWAIYMERGLYERGRTYTVSLTAWDDWGAQTETVAYTYTT